MKVLNVLLLGCIALCISFSTSHAQEYQFEEFLRFPSVIGVCDMKYTTNMPALALDNEDHLCLKIGATISVYNDEGDEIREINLAGDKDVLYRGVDYCFDNRGWIYTYMNKRSYGKAESEQYRKLIIDEFEPDGRLSGTMESIRLGFDEYKTRIFLGGEIHFIQGCGLIIYNDVKWEHIPVSFTSSIIPGFGLRDSVVINIMLDDKSYVSPVVKDWQVTELKIVLHTGESKSITINDEPLIYWRHICSEDPYHQYFLMFGTEVASRKCFWEVRKYRGDTLIFATHRIYFPGSDFSVGKRAIVNRNETIYYTTANDEEIKVNRLVLR